MNIFTRDETQQDRHTGKQTATQTNLINKQFLTKLRSVQKDFAVRGY